MIAPLAAANNPAVLALDIGSSSLRAALFDERARLASKVVTRAYALRYSDAGAAELDPKLLSDAASSALAHFRAGKHRYGAIASCCLWHGLLGLDDKLRPLTPVYTWADSRSRPDAARLRREVAEGDVLQRTGCMLRFAFWPAKLRWLRRTQRALFRRVRFWVSPGDFVLHSLHRELVTSASMASGTGLFDQKRQRWTLCDLAGIRESQLPSICDRLDGNIFTPIGDGAAGNLGCGATTPDVAAINLGTSGAIRVTIDRPIRIPVGLFRYVVDSRTFVLGGAISNAGNLQQWCERELRIGKNFELDRAAGAEDALVALPFFVAERAPDWPEIPALISAITPATKAEEIYHALVTSAFYRIADIFNLLEKSVGRIGRLVVSGGLTKSRTLPGLLADVLGRDLEIAAEREASLRGAAIHALRSGGGITPPTRRGRIIHRKKELTEAHDRRRGDQRALTKKMEQASVQAPHVSRADASDL